MCVGARVRTGWDFRGVSQRPTTELASSQQFQFQLGFDGQRMHIKRQGESGGPLKARVVEASLS